MYCPQAEFVKRFGQRELDQLLATGDQAGHPKAETGRTYDSAAADADAIVDSYLAMRAPALVFPLNPVPARVLELAADLTRYELYDDVKDEDAPSAIVVRRKLALDFLKAVAKGEATIPGLFADPTTAAEAQVTVYARERVFTDDTLAGY